MANEEKEKHEKLILLRVLEDVNHNLSNIADGSCKYDLDDIIPQLVEYTTRAINKLKESK
jgi:hypothetical protein